MGAGWAGSGQDLGELCAGGLRQPGEATQEVNLWVGGVDRSPAAGTPQELAGPAGRAEVPTEPLDAPGPLPELSAGHGPLLQGRV